MPCMFARVNDEPGEGAKRLLVYRNEEHLEVVPEQIRAVPNGTLVFLYGLPGNWHRAVPLGHRGWPHGLPSPDELHEHRDGVVHPMELRCAADGEWAIDPRGLPC